MAKKKRHNWYHKWHSHPMHAPVHWLVFLLAVIGVYFYINARVTAAFDTTPPTVVITYPTAKSNITPGSTISITTAAADDIAIGSVYIDVLKVNKYPSGKGTKSGGGITLTKLHECTLINPPYICSWVVPLDRNTAYMTQAGATDTSGNKTISKYVEFLVR